MPKFLPSENPTGVQKYSLSWLHEKQFSFTPYNHRDYLLPQMETNIFYEDLF